MTKTKVNFSKNEDGITTTMTVNGKITKDRYKDIPYVPHALLDCRGLNLYTLLQELDLTIEDLDITADENLQAILEGEKYAHHPYHVVNEIKARTKRD